MLFQKETNMNDIKITKVEITDDTITSRGGLLFVLRYIENTAFFKLFENIFGYLKTSSKGLTCLQFIKQVVAFFIDGTDMAMTSFDRRNNDEAYAKLLENTIDEMATSHQIKRFLQKFIVVGNWLFRKILLELFMWRLHVEQPDIIILFADTMVMNNDDAVKREGVEPTYKRKKGFQPFQISWGRYVVDAIFRTGSTHSNHGLDMMKAIGRLTKTIRMRYKDVPIIVLTDSAFMDDDNFRFFEEKLKILYICGGKKYQDLKDYVSQLPAEAFTIYSNSNQQWRYTEFGNQLKSWDTFRRCIFTTLETENDGQIKLEFIKTDSFLYTNIGQNDELTEKLVQAGGEEYLETESIIKLNHYRGNSELNHRSIKEFNTKEQLPFEKFEMNRAFYYIMLISHVLYEAYKYDVTADILPTTIYPTTFRRRLIDFAAKIVCTGRYYILKVTRFIYNTLNIERIWELCDKPIPIPIV